MTLWLDNQLPPALAAWMRATLFVDCVPVRDLNLHRASDPEIFRATRDAQVVVMTKDADFVGRERAEREFLLAMRWCCRTT